jgi:hypothetical protein
MYTRTHLKYGTVYALRGLHVESAFKLVILAAFIVAYTDRDRETPLTIHY